MKFPESGLPQNPLIEKAFNYSFNNVMAQRDEEMADLQERIKAMFDANYAKLNMAKSKLSEADFNKNKDALDLKYKQFKQMAPALVAKELLNTFTATRVPSAKELVNYGGDIPQELIASALLVKCVRSPVDYVDIEKTFGNKIATIVADVAHLDAYPFQRADYAKTISSESKMCYMAQVISSMNYITAEATKAAANGAKLALQDGQEETTFNDLKMLWGANKMFDQRFIASFNKMTQAIGSPMEIRVGAQGRPELADRTKKLPPPRPSGPGEDIVF